MEPPLRHYEVMYKQLYMELRNTRTSLRAREQRHPKPQMQTMRSKLEELDRRNEHVIKTVIDRSNEVLQRTEALVG